MSKKIMSILAVSTLISFAISGAAFAASNPAGTGQPGTPTVSCGEGNAIMQPKGFLTDGFQHATTVYAGSPGTPSLLHANSTHAVSQYDIACYQHTTNH